MTRPQVAALLTACAAVLVTVAGMAFAWSLRPPAPAPQSVEPPPDELRCGATACQPVVKQDVGKDAVELLVGQGSGRIRINGASGRYIFELTIASSGAAITDRSLECVDAEVAVCLVRGAVGNEVWGEVLVRRANAWSRAQLPYVSSGAYLGLHDVNADAVADVVAVQRACASGVDCPRRFAQVFSLVGTKTELGCTAVVNHQDQLPGWPDVSPGAGQLRSCGR
ncbi:hypothetical protein FHS29_001672 [Saccharothrix tamanrassetensis]|uniref:Uncharacterized protein n=1 Tax=Saccharothrix tamanrassetensis TaxID=1051531 RepID=A0A841C984_9PSEU|nr:hypothetical protein [Saccharothrix tamanrassetensis]MBB5955102.1 hypothetical protein [Saccharothrix tamanrassetensis]